MCLQLFNTSNVALNLNLNIGFSNRLKSSFSGYEMALVRSILTSRSYMVYTSISQPFRHYLGELTIGRGPAQYFKLNYKCLSLRTTYQQAPGQRTTIWETLDKIRLKNSFYTNIC